MPVTPASPASSVAAGRDIPRWIQSISNPPAAPVCTLSRGGDAGDTRGWRGRLRALLPVADHTLLRGMHSLCRESPGTAPEASTIILCSSGATKPSEEGSEQRAAQPSSLPAPPGARCCGAPPSRPQQRVRKVQGERREARGAQQGPGQHPRHISRLTSPHSSTCPVRCDYNPEIQIY